MGSECWIRFRVGESWVVVSAGFGLGVVNVGL